MRLGWGAFVLCAAAATSLWVTQPGHATEETGGACKAPVEATRLVHPLHRTMQRIVAGDPLTIVAIGSSSTAGAGASSPAAAYPSRLAVELKKKFPNNRINVINRGVNGEEARDMIARFETSVLAEHPDLVLWQVGTNAVLRDDPLVPSNLLIREGVRRLKSFGADVVLVDLQFAPKVIVKPEAEAMVALISAAAKEANVDLFQRYAVMRYWREHEKIPFANFLSPDELHMNDWSYGCIAKLLGGAITEVVNRSINAQTSAVTQP